MPLAKSSKKSKIKSKTIKQTRSLACLQFAETLCHKNRLQCIGSIRVWGIKPQIVLCLFMLKNPPREKFSRVITMSVERIVDIPPLVQSGSCGIE